MRITLEWSRLSKQYVRYGYTNTAGKQQERDCASGPSNINKINFMKNWFSSIQAITLKTKSYQQCCPPIICFGDIRCIHIIYQTHKAQDYHHLIRYKLEAAEGPVADKEHTLQQFCKNQTNQNKMVSQQRSSDYLALLPSLRIDFGVDP